MANKNAKPPKSAQYKPGKSGNPKGRPGGLMTYWRIRDIFSWLCEMPPDELREIRADGKHPSSIEAFIAAIFVEGIDRGDVTRFQYLLDRGIGKAPDAAPEKPDDKPDDLTPEEMDRQIRELEAKGSPNVAQPN